MLKGHEPYIIIPHAWFNVMISVSTKMLYQEVREISLRSGKSQGEIKFEKKVATLLNLNKFF